MYANVQIAPGGAATMTAYPGNARMARYATVFPTEMEIFVMNLLKRLSVLFLSVMMVTAMGCAGTATQESTGEYVTDSWITTKVKALLVEDSLVRATEVNVETFKGAVQLSGFVSSAAAMNQAVQVARGVKGVNSVKNDMRIK